jgi:hypothetical protein
MLKRKILLTEQVIAAVMHLNYTVFGFNIFPLLLLGDITGNSNINIRKLKSNVTVIVRIGCRLYLVLWSAPSQGKAVYCFSLKTLPAQLFMKSLLISVCFNEKCTSINN